MKITPYKNIIEEILKVCFFPIIKSPNSDQSPKRKLTKEIQKMNKEVE